MTTLANYIDRGGESVYRPPFVAQDVRYYGFLLDADPETLQTNLCDRYFNDPSGEPGRFRPALPGVMLVMCRLKELRSETPPYSDYGWFAEAETAFWVLLVDTKLERLVWVFPYIWVDNAYALAMGREVYGFPKGLGRFDIPEDPHGIQALSCDALAIRTFGPDSQGDWERIIDVRRTEDAPGHDRWRSAEEVARDLLGSVRIFEGQGLLGDLRLAAHTMADLFQGRLTFAFLKQFRDTAQTDKACYASLVEVACEMTHFKGGGLLNGRFEVDLPPLDSHPIARDLGLADGPLPVGTAFWMDFDFLIGPGKEVAR